MTKTELIKVVKDTVSETLEGVTAKDTAVFVDATIKAIQDTVIAGERVQIVGFGTFETTTRAAREGRNPATGESISIPASKAPKFKAGKAFKEAVKNA
nr:MAG TPA: DNA binding protein [Caudoviricetes sp.]